MVAVAIIFLSIIFVLSVIGIGVWHTQRMAQLNGWTSGSDLSKSELVSIQKEMIELRQMITSLAINVENMKDNYVHVTALEDRMTVGEWCCAKF